MGAPQRGQWPVADRCSMTSPVCTPPLRIAARVAFLSDECSAVSVSWSRVSTRRRGSSEACHSVSSASRLPTPAITDWSSSRALTGAVPRPTRSRNSATPTSAASGPSRVRSGSSRTRPRRRLSKSRSSPPSAKRRVKRSQAGSRSGDVAVVPRTRSPPSTGDPVAVGDHDPPAHAEVDPQQRPVAGGLAPHALAASQGGGEPASDEGGADLAGGVRAADPGVGVVDVGDLAVQRAGLDDRAGALDLGQLGHAGQARAVSTIGSSSVMAIVCSMCAPREPSALRSVQPSGSVKISSVVCRNHGSMAITRPGLSGKPRPARAVVGDVGVAVHGPADPVAAELQVDPSPSARATDPIAWLMSPIRLPDPGGRDAGVERPLRSRR